MPDLGSRSPFSKASSLSLISKPFCTISTSVKPSRDSLLTANAPTMKTIFMTDCQICSFSRSSLNLFTRAKNVSFNKTTACSLQGTRRFVHRWLNFSKN